MDGTIRSTMTRLGRITALPNPDGGVRGIVVGDVLRRFVARTTAQQIGDQVEQATSPFQFTLKTRAGLSAWVTPSAHFQRWTRPPRFCLWMVWEVLFWFPATPCCKVLPCGLEVLLSVRESQLHPTGRGGRAGRPFDALPLQPWTAQGSGVRGRRLPCHGNRAPHRQGIKVLGVPVGRSEFTQAILKAKTQEHRILFDRITAMGDLQSAWCIFLNCAAARANFWLWTVRPDFGEFAGEYDASLWRHPCGPSSVVANWRHSHWRRVGWDCGHDHAPLACPRCRDQVHRCFGGRFDCTCSVRSHLHCQSWISWLPSGNNCSDEPQVEEEVDPTQPKHGWQRKATMVVDASFHQHTILPALEDLPGSQAGWMASVAFVAIPWLRETVPQPFQPLFLRRLRLFSPQMQGSWGDMVGCWRMLLPVGKLGVSSTSLTDVVWRSWLMGSQLAIDTTMVSPLSRDGSLWGVRQPPMGRPYRRPGEEKKGRGRSWQGSAGIWKTFIPLSKNNSSLTRDDWIFDWRSRSCFYPPLMQFLKTRRSMWIAKTFLDKPCVSQMHGGSSLRRGDANEGFNIPSGIGCFGKDIGWLVTWEFPLRTDSASWKSSESFIQFTSFCSSWSQPDNSTKVFWSSKRFRLTSVLKVEPWNFRNSISSRFCWWTSRKSFCCSWLHRSWRSCWSRCWTFTVLARWRSLCWDSLVSSNSSEFLVEFLGTLGLQWASWSLSSSSSLKSAMEESQSEKRAAGSCRGRLQFHRRHSVHTLHLRHVPGWQLSCGKCLAIHCSRLEAKVCTSPEAATEGTNFGNPVLANPIANFWCHCGAAKGGRANPEKVGAPKGGGLKGGTPKFRSFFPSPATVFILFSLSFGLFRGIWVVFEAPGPSNKCACLEFSGCRAHTLPHTHNKTHKHKKQKTNNTEHWPTPKPTTTQQHKKWIGQKWIGQNWMGQIWPNLHPFQTLNFWNFLTDNMFQWISSEVGTCVGQDIAGEVRVPCMRSRSLVLQVPRAHLLIGHWEGDAQVTECASGACALELAPMRHALDHWCKCCICCVLRCHVLMCKVEPPTAFELWALVNRGCPFWNCGVREMCVAPWNVRIGRGLLRFCNIVHQVSLVSIFAVKQSFKLWTRFRRDLSVTIRPVLPAGHSQQRSLSRFRVFPWWLAWCVKFLVLLLQLSQCLVWHDTVIFHSRRPWSKRREITPPNSTSHKLDCRLFPSLCRWRDVSKKNFSWFMTRFVVDHVISPMIPQPMSIGMISFFFAQKIIPCLSSSRNVLHKYFFSICDLFTLRAAARSLFVKSTPSFQRIHSLIGVSGNLRFQHSFPERCCRAGSSLASKSSFASFHSFRECWCASSIKDCVHAPHPWNLNGPTPNWPQAHADSQHVTADVCCHPCEKQTLDCCFQWRGADHSLHGCDVVSRVRSRSFLLRSTGWKGSNRRWVQWSQLRQTANQRPGLLGVPQLLGVVPAFHQTPWFGKWCVSPSSHVVGPLFPMVVALTCCRSAFHSCCWLMLFSCGSRPQSISCRPQTSVWTCPLTSKSLLQHAAASRAWSSPHHHLFVDGDKLAFTCVGPIQHIWRKTTRKWHVDVLTDKFLPCNPSLTRLSWCPYFRLNRSELPNRDVQLKPWNSTQTKVVTHVISPIGLQQFFSREGWHVQQCSRINLAEIGQTMGACRSTPHPCLSNRFDTNGLTQCVLFDNFKLELSQLQSNTIKTGHYWSDFFCTKYPMSLWRVPSNKLNLRHPLPLQDFQDIWFAQ